MGTSSVVKLILFGFVLRAFPVTAIAAQQVNNGMDMDPYNVVWTSPSKDAAGSMPLGNGGMGVNAWVTADGNLHFYLSRPDSFSEISRLLKIGEVTINFAPSGIKAGDFKQSLILKNGTIQIDTSRISLVLFFDPKSSTVYVKGKYLIPTLVSAKLSTWRTSPHTLIGDEIQSSWTMRDAPFPLTEQPDQVIQNSESTIVYHRNESTIVPFTLKHQGIESLAGLLKDPLLHRNFGALLMESPGFSSHDFQNSNGTLETIKPIRNFCFQVTTGCNQANSSAEFLKGLQHDAKIAPSPVSAEKASIQWWRQFWDRSYIEVTAPTGADQNSKEDCFRVTQSYALQRFMMACASKGDYPFKFNGSIFTVEPAAMGKTYDPDWRRWGDGYWWQNMRLGYWAMLACGDFDQMQPLFHLYESATPLSIARTNLYYHAQGVYYPETMSLFGSYSNGDYGWNRTGEPASQIDCPYWQFAWNQGVELVQLMLDRVNASPNSNFLKKELLPTAHQVVLYFQSRFPHDPDGKMRITPDQSIETYWTGVQNDTPCVAGLHAILPRLLALKGISKSDRDSWEAFQKQLPAVPVTDGKVLPAEKFDKDRSNVENPELYALWPFRLYGEGHGLGNLSIAQKTFQDRIEKSNYGWQYDGQCAAIAGLAEEAKDSLISKSKGSNPSYRFPAMWGPNYDWLPDQDHGANLMLTLQSMVLQTVDGKDLLLPAWPSEWHVKYKLLSVSGKVVEGTN